MLKLIGSAVLGLAMFAASQTDSCDTATTPESASGVQKVTTTVQVGSDGLTTEQRNVKDRLAMDNKPGSIKHLYVISSFSGQALMYSTVRGKVTSSGKRLTPTTASYAYTHRNSDGNLTDGTTSGFWVSTPNGGFYSNEVLQDDGTYGQSGEYLYWWDTQGRYRQIYNGGGTFIMLSDQPLPLKSITLNMENTTPN